MNLFLNYEKLTSFLPPGQGGLLRHIPRIVGD